MQCRKYGAELVYTQMYNANSFINSKVCRASFTTCEGDLPLIFQLGGHDPDTMLKAARLVEDRVDDVDINLGCPQAIAKRGHYGAYLMEELDLLVAIVTNLSRNLKVPVTCKTRIYKDFDRSVKLCETLISAGASLLTIHGRTRSERGHNIVGADWDMIRRLREHFNGRVPILANGGIECYDDIDACMKYTGCEGVMVSEAVLENPSFFVRNIYQGIYVSHAYLAHEYLDYTVRYPVHFKAIRSHLMKMLHRYFLVHTELRDRAGMAGSVEQLHEICKVLLVLYSKYYHADMTYTVLTIIIYLYTGADAGMREPQQPVRLPRVILVPSTPQDHWTPTTRC